MDSQAPKKVSVFSIFAMTFRISAFTLGGGPVLIGLIKEATEQTGLVTEERTSDMLALSLAAPGALGVSMSYQAGLALGGPIGALAAFFNGATAALVIVLGLVVWNLAKKNALKTVKDTVICLLVAVSVLVLKVSPVWGLLGGTVVAMIVNLIIEKKEAGK